MTGKRLDLRKLDKVNEREKTGIKNLKIKYNKVFGYYLEVTNSFKDLVPDYYTRKQTLANAERYIIPELKELEDTILGAEDKLYSLEYELYSDIRSRVAKDVVRVQKTAKVIAQIDTLASLALVAEQNNYVRPKINEKGVIDIKEGRHPVVEKMIPNDMFISNDTYLNDKKGPDRNYNGTEHGRKVYLHAPDSPDCPDGSDWFFCSCLQSRHRSGRPYLYPCRSFR